MTSAFQPSNPPAARISLASGTRSTEY
jgi:hypothetical protein